MGYNHLQHIENQWSFIKKQLIYTQENSPYYQAVFNEISFEAKSSSPQDFLRIPVTRKKDFAQHNEKFRSIPKVDIIDYVTTSGTTGKPVTIALNEHDLQRLAQNEENSFRMAGVTSTDVVQLTTTLNRRFMAGMAYFLGLRKIGAGIVRVGSGVPELQWESIERFQPSYLVAVPSFLLRLVDYAVSHNIDFNKSSVKAAICIGESLRDINGQPNALKRKINKDWNIELFSTYASTEMSTAFTECNAHHGNHIQEDLIFTEILDKVGNPVPDGEIGELVVTPLQTQTMPIVRYATGDLVKKISATCSCGRRTKRVSAVLGRKQNLLKYKGTTLYPEQIKNTLVDFDGIDDYIILVTSDSVHNDSLKIVVSDQISANDQQRLKSHLRAKLRVVPNLVLWDSEKIKRKVFDQNQRKTARFIDERRTNV